MTALAYDVLHDLVDDPTFQKRVKFAVFVSATTALGGKGPVVVQQKTQNWASAILKGTARLDYRLFGLRILATFSQNPTDLQLQNFVDNQVPQLVVEELGG